MQAAGNEACSLSNPAPQTNPEGLVYSKLLARLAPEKFSNLILSLNLKPNNTLSKSSNTPGSHKILYQNSLAAQGSQTFWLDETGEYLPVKKGGTSSAAPVITGACAVLQSYKPHFSPVLIKNCLLHSALRDFMIYDKQGYVVSLIYDTSPTATSLLQKPYDFQTYGMGILNLKAAVAYADLLDAHLQTAPSSSSQEPSLSFEAYESLRPLLKTCLEAPEPTPALTKRTEERDNSLSFS